MKRFKMSTMVHQENKEDPNSKETTFKCLINMDHVSIVLPGPKPGYLSVVLENKTRYLLKQDVDDLMEEGNRDD